MRRIAAIGLLALLIAGPEASRAMASALEVTPVRIQVDLPDMVSTITVRNPGTQPLAAQLRVFKWSHANGADELVPTKDVVASPPLAKLAPGQPYAVRIIRVSKAAVAGEESYRLLVDEIPDPKAQAPGFGPRFAIRQSIPVFFTDPAAAPRLAWEAVLESGKLLLRARNEGSKRVRISALKVTNAAGGPLATGSGLTGYVFGRSSEQWTLPATSKGLAAGSPITILAQSDNGPIKATVAIRPAK